LQFLSKTPCLRECKTFLVGIKLLLFIRFYFKFNSCKWICFNKYYNWYIFFELYYVDN